MEEKFNVNQHGLDLSLLREFCEREGEPVSYNKGQQMEQEGRRSQWFAYVTQGCFKYMTRGLSDGCDHITWFSFEGEFVADYPRFLYGHPSQVTIEAMMPSRVLRVSGEQLLGLFEQNMEMMRLRALIGEHLLSQMNARYIDLHRTTPRERYEMLLQRCPGIVSHLPLKAIASFLNITPKTLSIIRRDVTFESMDS